MKRTVHRTSLPFPADGSRRTRVLQRCLTFFVSFTVLIAILGTCQRATSAAVAQPPPDFEGRHPRGRPTFDRFLERNAQRLKLDEATLDRIRAVSTAAMKEIQPLRQQIQDGRDEMRHLLGQDTPDEAAVMQQTERIGKLEIEMQKQRLRTMLRIRALLTPEQRQEMVKIHDERRGRQRRHVPDESAPPRPDATPSTPNAG